MSFIDTIKSLFSGGGSLEDKLKEKFKKETINKVTGAVVKKLIEDMPGDLAEAGESAITAYVSEKAGDMVKVEVEKQTGGKFQELTDIIVEEATGQVVDAAVQQIKDQLG
ncbi:hypothetical protein [Candidatus Uabimicrobium sp. HlEnr_7]|uniref:hypothetical protein n=1 Tax=Candidatus Uabimicrobium helgolandensis TaxID=3095367 RepID=UPI003556AB29